jgi:RNA polymerase sigma-70 factor (ECF subfamily)
MTSLPPASPPGRPDPASLFEGWVRSHHAAVYRSAWRITRNGADAEDVAQRVFVAVLRRLTRHELPEWTNGAEVGDRLRWLAVKTALDFRRGEANRRRREEARAMETSERSAEVAPDPARAELLQQLRRCVTRLPEELRIATVLRFEEGLPFAAMAEVVGVSEPTMFERVKRALEKLRVGLAAATRRARSSALRPIGARQGVAVPRARGRRCSRCRRARRRRRRRPPGPRRRRRRPRVARRGGGGRRPGRGGAAAVHAVRSTALSSNEAKRVAERKYASAPGAMRRPRAGARRRRGPGDAREGFGARGLTAASRPVMLLCDMGSCRMRAERTAGRRRIFTDSRRRRRPAAACVQVPA